VNDSIRSKFTIAIAIWYHALPSLGRVLRNMAKSTRSVSTNISVGSSTPGGPGGPGGPNKRDARDLRALLHVPQHDLQAQLTSRLERLGFPSLRPAQVQLMSAIGVASDTGVRLSDLVVEVSLPKQTVGDLLDELEEMRMVERFPDPDHGVIKRVRLGPKGKTWAQEVRRVSAATEARWATRLGSKKMRSLRALLEELASTVEERPARAAKPAPSANGEARRAHPGSKRG
jgi:DNA-binding MarR family transcriptional regulator